MQTMTMREYLKYAVMKEIAHQAEKEGIRIIDGPRPKPKLVADQPFDHDRAFIDDHW